MYTEIDIQRLLPYVSGNLLDTITAKKRIQETMAATVSNEERVALSNDILLNSLINRVVQIAATYADTTGKDDSNLICIAMATGTILKELDNGNTSYVSYPYLAKIMNQL